MPVQIEVVDDGFGKVNDPSRHHNLSPRLGKAAHSRRLSSQKHRNLQALHFPFKTCHTWLHTAPGV